MSDPAADHDALVKSLTVERYGRSTWWHTAPKPKPMQDDELTCARRRRELVAEASRTTPTRPAARSHSTAVAP